MSIDYYRPSLLNIFRWKGSIIPYVILPTLILTSFTAIVTVIHMKTNIKLSIPQSFTLIPVTSFAIALLLTYRLNSACDKVVKPDVKNVNKTDEKEEREILIEKKVAIKLLIGFAFALKHYLREEEGNILEDVKPYLNIKSSLPGFENLNRLEVITENQKPNTSSFIKKKKQPFIELKPNLPLEISLYISGYITTQLRKKRIEPPIASNMLTIINLLVEYITRFERILKTPLPIAFSIHLYQTLWIYCLSLPFQLVASVGWITIVIVFFVSFILFGVERIAAEVQNPFGYGYNHFDLDYFCETVKREITAIIKHDPPDDSHW
ncbi:1661_t:CDS:2, partial [Gigaspora rosea]